MFQFTIDTNSQRLSAVDVYDSPDNRAKISTPLDAVQNFKHNVRIYLVGDNIPVTRDTVRFVVRFAGSIDSIGTVTATKITIASAPGTRGTDASGNTYYDFTLAFTGDAINTVFSTNDKIKMQGAIVVEDAAESANAMRHVEYQFQITASASVLAQDGSYYPTTTALEEHNASPTAHQDIRDMIQNVNIATTTTPGVVKLGTPDVLDATASWLAVNANGQAGIRRATATEYGAIKLATSATLGDKMGYVGLNGNGQAGIGLADSAQSGVARLSFNPLTTAGTAGEYGRITRDNVGKLWAMRCDNGMYGAVSPTTNIDNASVSQFLSTATIKTLLAGKVSLGEENQVIGGLKTFAQCPRIPAIPDSDYSAVSKYYIDGLTPKKLYAKHSGSESYVMINAEDSPCPQMLISQAEANEWSDQARIEYQTKIRIDWTDATGGFSTLSFPRKTGTFALEEYSVQKSELYNSDRVNGVFFSQNSTGEKPFTMQANSAQEGSGNLAIKFPVATGKTVAYQEDLHAVGDVVMRASNTAPAVTGQTWTPAGTVTTTGTGAATIYYFQRTA